MANPTPQQTAFVQQASADVEVAYQAVLRARRAIDTLARAGQLTCGDVRNYNLQASAVWAYQESTARIIRAGGGAPPAIPEPSYIAWKNIPGDQAADIDCNAPGMRGTLGRIFGRGRLGAPIDGNTITWRTGASVKDKAHVDAVVARALATARKASGPNLGNPIALVVTIVLVGILVAVAKELVIAIGEAFHDTEGKRLDYKSVSVQAQQNTAILEKRASCYADCSGKGRDPALCATSCATAYPPFKPTLSSNGLGIVGTIAGVAIIGVVGFAGFKWVSGGGIDRMRSSSGRRLSERHELDEGAIDA